MPSSEFHLRQLGDQMYGNRMRLQQTIPLTPPSPRCTSSSPTNKTKPPQRSGRFKKFSLSRHRNRKTSKHSDSPDQDFDVGAFATHLMAENCLGNLKVGLNDTPFQCFLISIPKHQFFFVAMTDHSSSTSLNWNIEVIHADEGSVPVQANGCTIP